LKRNAENENMDLIKLINKILPAAKPSDYTNPQFFEITNGINVKLNGRLIADESAVVFLKPKRDELNGRN